MAEQVQTTQRKAKRVTQACDFCHQRGIKCRPAPAEMLGAEATCLTCVEYSQKCTQNRRPKKRGTKPKLATVSPITALSSGPSNLGQFGIPAAVHEQGPRSRKIITTLLDVYLDTIHPTFPLFCEREIWVGWRDGSFPSGPSDYMSLICMCALSVQHVRNGTLFTDDISASECVSSSQDYIDEAVRLTPVDLGSADTNVIRSYGFLALLGAQTGNSAMTHRYLGLYHGLCAQFGLHDESRWPASISSCEREVRQRLWWAMYRLEVHTACVLGNLVHCSEAQCNVDYPMGLHHPAFLLGRDGPYEDWFAGWNLTTDLYRVLEHAIVDFRSKKTERPQGGSILGERARPPSAFIASKLAQTQAELLPHFRTAWTRSSDSGRNRCGFQALNILCTIHLARTIASISCEGGPQPACEMACQMMESIGSIPLEYVRALGLPFLQQLAGVGYMLVGVAHKYELSHVEYDRLRDVVTTIIQFLERLTDHNHVAANTVKRLVKRLKNLDRPSCSEVVSDAVDDSFGPKLLPDEIAYGIMYDQDAFPSALLDDYI